MKKIALFCDNCNGVSGIRNYCIRLEKLFCNDDEYRFYSFYNLPYKPFSSAKLYNIKIIEQILISQKFDIIHINGFISTLPFYIDFAMKNLGLHIPVVYTPHAHPFYTLNHPIRNKYFFYFFVKRILHKANCVISINKEDYLFFRKFNDNVVTIPHWTEYTAKATDKTKSSKRILFVGRNDENKNLKILYSIPSDKYEVVCVTDKAPERKDFVWLHDITDYELSELYTTSALTIIPSRYEAFSYTALESLLSGTPILISDRVRISDFLNNISGVTIFDFNNTEDFLEKIEDAKQQSVDVNNVQNIFSVKKAYRSYLDVYANVLNNK